VNIISGARRGSGISIFSVGGNGGYGLGPILAVALVSGLGMKGLIIYGVLAVLMGLAVQHLTPRIAASADSILAQSQEEEKAAAASLNTAASETNFAKAEDSATQAADITKATQSAAATNSTTVAAKAPAQATPSAGTNDWRSFCRLTLVIVFRSVVINGIYSFLPLYCISILLTSKALGSTTLSVLSIAGILTTLVGGWIADKLGYVKVLRYGSLLLIPVMAAIVLTQNIWVVYLMMLPLSLAFNGTYAPFVVLGQTYLAKNIGFASGITLGLSMTVGGIITPVLGWYADHYGLPAAMNSLVVVAAICAACTFLLSEPEKRYNQ
jgi:FSR family fosmidomycin resistance protein-like MFS transporter